MKRYRYDLGASLQKIPLVRGIFSPPLSPLRAVLQRAVAKPPEPAADWEAVVRDAVRRELGKTPQS